MTPTQETSRKTLSRRALLGMAAGTALLPVAVSGGTARAARHHGPAPETVALPAGFRPEGIASGPGTTYYAGSMANFPNFQSNGIIVTGDLLTGSQSVLVPAWSGRAVRGLYFDDRSGLLWAAGNLGTKQFVWAIRATDGKVVYEESVLGGVFHNDVVVTANRVFVTDSGRDWLVVVPLGADAQPAGSPGYLLLSGVWPITPPGATAANGIRELPDGSLVLNNSRPGVGGLWQVNPTTGVTSPIPVKGGPGLVGGDGLEIDGTTLYDVRGSDNSSVSVLLLSPAGSGWTAKWAGARTDETLDVPSTATLAGGWLWVINARFGTTPTVTTPYWITRLSAR
jgi:hypothetical protein